MAKTARVIGETLLNRGRFDLTKTVIEVAEEDGSTRTLAHEVYRHGLAAAVLLYDPKRGVVTLVKQFRAGAFSMESGRALKEAVPLSPGDRQEYGDDEHDAEQKPKRSHCHGCSLARGRQDPLTAS